MHVSEQAIQQDSLHTYAPANHWLMQKRGEAFQVHVPHLLPDDEYETDWLRLPDRPAGGRLHPQAGFLRPRWRDPVKHLYWPLHPRATQWQKAAGIFLAECASGLTYKLTRT